MLPLAGDMMKINKHFEYRKRRARFVAALATMALLLATLASVMAQTTGFTYQGKLTDNGNPATGNYDFQFKLFDTQTVGTGTQQGSPVLVPNVTVTSGIFTVQLDFGAAVFDGTARYLEISVKQTSGSTFTTLGPRQPISSTPYTIKSLNAANATTADGLSVACVNCVTSSQIQNVQGSQVTGNISGSQISGTIPVASVPPGSTSYIQNTTSTQTSSSFNISGDGISAGTLSGNILNAATQYNIAGSRVLSAGGTDNIFAGLFAGTSNTTGIRNSFFGSGAGAANTTNENSFFGWNAGAFQTAGQFNSFFGSGAGRSFNGSNNSFFGYATGSQGDSGTGNTFIGYSADLSPAGAIGDNNTLLGANTRVTQFAGGAGIPVHNATVIGANASVSSANVTNATVVGVNASVVSSSFNVRNATALGANATVTASDSLVLGNGANVGIGISAPTRPLHIVTSLQQVVDIQSSSSTGTWLNLINTNTGGRNWNFISTGSQNGEGAGKLLVRDNPNNAVRMTFDTAGNVGIGTTSPLDKLQVAGNLRVGTGTNGCVRDANATVIAGACSSDARLKRNITPFPKVLEKLARLQPVHFYWNTREHPERGFGESLSFGLVAQDVERIMPELIAEEDDGYKAVRYNKLPLLMLQGIKELKADNDVLKRENEKLKQRLEEQEARLRRLEAKLGR